MSLACNKANSTDNDFVYRTVTNTVMATECSNVTALSPFLWVETAFKPPLDGCSFVNCQLVGYSGIAPQLIDKPRSAAPQRICLLISSQSGLYPRPVCSSYKSSMWTMITIAGKIEVVAV
jgi:hypothetical protein